MKKLIILLALTASACSFNDPMAFHLEVELNQMAQRIGHELDDVYALEIVVEDRRKDGSKLWHLCEPKENRIVFDKFALSDYEFRFESLDRVWPHLLHDIGECAYGLEEVSWEEQEYPLCNTVARTFQPPSAMMSTLTEDEALCVSSQKELYLQEFRDRLQANYEMELDLE